MRWKEIPFSEGRFSISDEGKIWDHQENKHRNIFLSATGYALASIKTTDGRTKTKKVHQLVADAFIPNHLNYKEINHIDCDKTNNHFTNLEWCSRGYNIKHAYTNGRRSAKGSLNANAKLNEEKIAFMRGLKLLGFTKSQIMPLMGINSSTWDSAISKGHWKHVAPTKLVLSE